MAAKNALRIRITITLNIRPVTLFSKLAHLVKGACNFRTQIITRSTKNSNLSNHRERMCKSRISENSYKEQ